MKLSVKNLLCRFFWLVLLIAPVASIASEVGLQELSRARMLSKVNASLESHMPVIIQYHKNAGKAAADSGKIDAPEGVTDFKRQQANLRAKVTGKVLSQSWKDFNLVPMSAARLSKAQIRTLLEDPNVSVYEDVLYRPSLAQSVARVYPTQDISIHHGDDRWAVAVLDTGVDSTHPFLFEKVIAEACFSDGGGQPSTQSVCPDGATTSTAAGSGLPCTLGGCEHGTQVAGIIAGSSATVDGVARDAKLISVQVYSRVNDEAFCFPEASCIGAFTSDIIAGMEHVYSLRNSFDIAAVNVSLGSSQLFSGTCDEQPEKPIIDLLIMANIAVVAASGNGASTSQMPSPACISSAVAVAATLDTADVAWSDNNISAALDLFAPGVTINTSTLGGGFADVTGTSFAAPHVAGAWAVLRDAAPTASVNQISAILKTVGPTVTQHTETRRRVDISGALDEVDELELPPTQPTNEEICVVVKTKEGQVATFCI